MGEAERSEKDLVGENACAHVLVIGSPPLNVFTQRSQSLPEVSIPSHQVSKYITNKQINYYW
ncbi:hypothetical protein SAMN04487969_12245 [Paenibacillus algorifonticola]|uniref:Uncharacterized protein n=1 Tax=Paenibacillus algorifonticola TaxID=684063 RepID=A0A1I2HC02_9BACL|nr:hypothetical protein SAMN04487969_12245 [Paenibacillus algorifonticola]